MSQQVTVVTGASTGIGEATALRLARDGNDVIATMRTPDASDLAKRAADEGVTLETRPLDVDHDDSVREALTGIVEDHGPIDVLVNNAGVGGGSACEDTSLDEFRRVMETNFFGVLRCTQFVLPSMRERGTGCIATVTSQAGRLAIAGMPAYVASKWAAEGLLETLAGEVAQFGIRVVIIEPGAIMTPIWSKAEPGPADSAYRETSSRLLAAIMHDLAHASDPSEVADCVSEAITATEPTLRWVVGRGAERNITHRSTMTDEELIRINTLPTAEYLAAMLPGEV